MTVQQENGSQSQVVHTNILSHTPLEQHTNHNNDGTVRMKREIGLFGGIAMIVGTMIGSGIFVSPTGLIKKVDSISLSLVVWAGCGVLSTLAALAYCELGTLIRRSGGEHAYYSDAFRIPPGKKNELHRFLGDLPGFIFSWVTVLLLKPSSLAINSLAFSKYALGPLLKSAGYCDNIDTTVEYDYTSILLAICIGSFVGFVNCFSAKIATKAQIVFTFGKISALLIIITVGIVNLVQGKTGHVPKEFDKSDANAGVIASAFYSGLWAYDGWNNLNFLTEELKEPKKNLPRAILVGIPLVTLFYVLVNISYFTVLSKQDMIDSSAVAVTFGDKTLGVFSFLMPLLVVLSVIGTSNGSQFTAGRISYVAAREGHMVEFVSYVHVKRLTPVVAILLNILLAVIMIFISDINELIDFFNFLAWIFYGTSMVALITLRYTKPDVPRTFKVPLIIPAIVILMSIYLVLGPIIDEPKVGYVFALGFIVLGVGVYAIFVFKKFTFSFMPKLTRTIQAAVFVAPSPYKED